MRYSVFPQMNTIASRAQSKPIRIGEYLVKSARTQLKIEIHLIRAIFLRRESLIKR